MFDDPKFDNPALDGLPSPLALGLRRISFRLCSLVGLRALLGHLRRAQLGHPRRAQLGHPRRAGLAVDVAEPGTCLALSVDPRLVRPDALRRTRHGLERRYRRLHRALKVPA